MTGTPEIHGSVAPGFEPVREAFAANFERDLDPLNAMLAGPGKCETGAAVAVFYRGQKVVDLWGGLADRRTGRPYTEDTLQLVFSTTKGVTAICANLLAHRGLLDLDAKVADYWPEFAKAGKADIPVRWLLCHRAGLPWVDVEMTIEDALDWDTVIEALEQQQPVWEPGTQHGYHATTFGWLVGEVVRRVSGKGVGQFVQDELAGPLGLDLWIGLPEKLHRRVAPLEVVELPTDPAMAAMVDQFIGPETNLGKALYAPGGAWSEHKFASFNLPEVWKAEIPAANCITNARSLAKLYAACVGEVQGPGGAIRLFTDEWIDKAIERQTEGVDHIIMGLDLQYGLGFNLPNEILKLGGHRSFGHYGAGGSVGFADPDYELGFGYVMNKMYLGLTGDPRTASLIDATYEALASSP
ncbi:MAG: beta-lactamase family protein [Acidimicrobiales bacterium]|nr:beta-lactamase family protein [Acidimicrobiales bacterium]